MDDCPRRSSLAAALSAHAPLSAELNLYLFYLRGHNKKVYCYFL